MSGAPFAAERAALKERALVRPAPELGVFSVTGKDRLPWLNGLVTCDLAKLPAGGGAYGLAVGKTGKLLAELFFLGAPDEVFVGLPLDRMEKIRDHFDRHLVMEDAEMGEPLARSFLLVQGPRTLDLITEARALGADAARIDWTSSPDSAVVLAPGGEGRRDELVSALLARSGGMLASDEAYEALRIEQGRPRFGADFDDETLPQEACLQTLAVSFNKGCYLGQETVFMLEKRGHAKKKLMRLAIEGDAPLAPRATLSLADGTALGEVTSNTRDPSGQGLVGLGYVKFKHATAGAELVSESRAVRVLGDALSR